jgi:hypothetical protein
MAAKERLDQLLQLAAQARWPLLARELTDLMLAWPPDYPAGMQAPVEALLEIALRQSGDDTQAELALRLKGHPGLPLKLLNLLYLAAPAPLRREILMRNELEADGLEEAHADADALLAAARGGNRDFARALGECLAIPQGIAAAILGDATGEALAVLCRGAGIDRATFSAVALLCGAKDMPLAAYDSVPGHAATRLVHFWRAQTTAPSSERIRAAE